MNNLKTIIIIPARGGSKGLPRKNVKIFNGKPLIVWTIEQAKQSNVDKIVVSTEDTEIKKVSTQNGIEVCDRPNKLSRDDSLIYDAIFYTLDYYEKLGEFFDIIVLCEPTKPLREVEDINYAIQIITSRIAPSVVSIIKAENNNPENFFTLCDQNGTLQRLELFTGCDLKPRQMLKDIFYPEGTIYASTVKELRKLKTFYHKDTFGYIVENHKATEIDELSDFISAEAKHKFYSYNENIGCGIISGTKNKKFGL